jgi:hypothetical protein
MAVSRISSASEPVMGSLVRLTVTSSTVPPLMVADLLDTTTPAASTCTV